MMKRFAFSILILAAFAASSSAQAMTASPAMSGSDSTAPADASGMMAPAPAMASSSDDAMSSDMSYDALKKSGKLADVKMGRELRMAKSSGMKVAYRSLMAAENLAAKKPTVLFFAADWCPSCQADLKDINANGSKLGSVNVVVVDYDKSADLKAKYGITVQDTFVQIDSMGAKQAIWNGGGVDGILKNLAKAM
jgi:thioredoxin 1